MRSRTPPAARNRGNRVPSGSSSPLQTRTSPASARVPSGHPPPRVTVAANSIAIVVFPVATAPAKISSFPSASHPDQIHRMTTGWISAPLAMATVAGNSAARPLPFGGFWPVDVRGDGGYIVAPGSRHISGRYYAVDVDHHPDDLEPAEMPLWLARAVRGPAKSNGHIAELPESWRKLVGEGVTEGQRNVAVARLAGHLLRKHVDPHVALDLCRTWNACCCRPPLTDAEIVRTVNSIAGCEIARRGASHA